ncbi:methyltransferase domain-containing protein [Streptomyces microflavus]|uniref:methyltransferase domain-containing protein n=1 Tax=Streptomyces microflavus TaxID=1919 RepID=UPI0036E26CEB
MTATTAAGRAVGHVTFEEVKASRPGVAEELTTLIAAEFRARVRHLAGFVSARIHLSLDGTSVVSRVEWSSEEHSRAALRDGGATLHALPERPGVVSVTTFAGEPAPGIQGPAAAGPVGVVAVAKRHVGERRDAETLARLLHASGGWKSEHPGFISATPYVSLDGATYLNYPQWVSEESFHSYMDDPRNAAGQDAIAVLETEPPEILLCALVTHIDAAPREHPPARAHSTGSLSPDTVSPLDQLRLFERKYDPGTTEILRRLPIRPRRRCLELGAGAGSMAYWLADTAPEGSVVAVDTDTGYLDPDRAGNLTVRKADITSATFAPGSFDLILARAVLEHLTDPDAMLDRALSWLAPGGWLVVEDFYFLPTADAPTAVGRSLLEAYVTQMREHGADLSWGRRLPAALARAGLTSVATRVTPAGPGQSAVDDELIALRMRQEGHTLVDGGQVTAGELDTFLGLLGTPEGRDLTTLLVSAWGRQPADPEER